jgi:L-2-hydroxyglutarate oxidase LhgO
VIQAERYDLLIIGAGVTGVAIARALATRRPELTIAVVEKEEGVACHTSGRNSGVAHPGFNPKPGTLKARFCVEGNRRIRELCEQKEIPCRNVGILVIARTATEEKTLEELYRRGQENGVPELRLLSKQELQQQEPNVKGCAALLAPTGSVVDSKCLVAGLAQEAQAQGVRFLFKKQVRAIEAVSHGYRVRAGNVTLETRQLINAAGLYADQIAHMLGAGRDYSIIPFRGEYYLVAEKKTQLVRAMIYPVPDLNYPFLGIHFTPTAHGELKVGPNAVLALGRESYKNSQIHFGETLAMICELKTWKLLNPGFIKMASHHVWTSLSKRAFLNEASTLVTGLEISDLLKGPPAGNRAQLVDRQGKLCDDLVVEQQGSAIHILNIVSPGFTCALPFAEYIAELVLGQASS